MTVVDGAARKTEGATGLGEAATEVAALARAGEPDRYLAALLAPPPQREALLALAAFAAELARIPRRAVREPFMGEVRLQWWRTALGLDDGGGDSGGHAVAVAMRAAVRSHDLPGATLNDMIDAQVHELRQAPFQDDAAVKMVLHTCEKMAAGGMYDQLGGGFARYSVDAQWLVPHFEKMLYDNAQLVQLYLDAYLVSGEKQHADVARDILEHGILERVTQHEDRAHLIVEPNRGSREHADLLAESPELRRRPLQPAANERRGAEVQLIQLRSADHGPHHAVGIEQSHHASARRGPEIGEQVDDGRPIEGGC